MMFVPVSSGIAGDLQLVVPMHIPDPATELVHVTAVTPTLSAAAPANVMTAAVVETFVLAGAVIVSVGAALSVACGGAVDGGV